MVLFEDKERAVSSTTIHRFRNQNQNTMAKLHELDSEVRVVYIFNSLTLFLDGLPKPNCQRAV